MSTPEENGGGLKLELGAFLDLGNKAVKHLKSIAGSQAGDAGILKPIVKSLNGLDVSGAGTVDFGMPSKGLMWMIRELICFESAHEFTSPIPSMATATGAAGAAVSATLPFFSPYMAGFDIEIQPSTAAGLATITVTGAGQPTLTYYLEESTTQTTSKSIRYAGIGIPYNQVSVSAVASGGIVTVNVIGIQAGSPAKVGWYVGAPDTSIGTPNQKPPASALRWTQGQGYEITSIFMPFFNLFGRKEFPVNSPDHLVAYLTGGISGESFVLAAIVEECKIKDVEAMST